MKKIIVAIALLLTAFVSYFAGVRSAIKVEQVRSEHQADELAKDFAKKEKNFKRTIEMQKIHMSSQQHIMESQSKQLLEMGYVPEESEFTAVTKLSKQK